jgi:raffinose/stachyose/melibiose transport system substrate-binding protein
MTNPMQPPDRHFMCRARFGALAATTTVIALLASASVASAETRHTAGSSTHVVLTVQSADAGNTGLLAAYAALDKKFEAAHPGVTVKFTTESFQQQTATLKLQLSGNSVPDVTQDNQGYNSLGELVTDGLVKNLDSLASTDDWSARQPTDLLALDGQWSSNGKTMGSGPIWGISATATWIGLYENTAVAKSMGITTAPTTFAQLEKDLSIGAAHHVIPLQFGSNDQGECSWLLGEMLMAVTTPKTLVNVVDGTSKTLPSAFVTVGKVLAQWQAGGYLTPNSGAYSSNQVYNNFLAGKGLFVLSGTWNEPLPGTPASTAKFTLIPFPLGNATQVGAVASGDFPWSIPTKSAQPKLAAEYINYITSPAANATWIANGQVPASTSSSEMGDVSASHYTGTSAQAVTGWLKLLDKGTLAPYMDWATPTFLATIGSATQSLIAGKFTPKAFASALQADYGPFAVQRG